MKYRLVRVMFCGAIVSGAIKAASPVIAATSGAVAIAGARFAILLGLDFTALVPATTPGEVLARIEREGAVGRWQVGEQPPAGTGGDEGVGPSGSAPTSLDHCTDAERAMSVCGESTIVDEIFVQLSGGHTRFGVDRHRCRNKNNLYGGRTPPVPPRPFDSAGGGGPGGLRGETPIQP